MSQFPSPQLEKTHFPPPAAQRNRRADRHQKNAPSSRNRKPNHGGKKKTVFTLFQKIVLSLLCLSLVITTFGMLHNEALLKELRAEKDRVQQEYENMVSRHMVKYRDMIEHYAARYQINPAFVAAVIYRESHYDPQAVSHVGARGLMQLMPDTGTWMAEKAGIQNYTHDDLFDPETNIWLGSRYLGYLSGKFDGDPILVACSYHAGAGNVKKWVEKYSSDGKTLTLDEIPMEDTQSYARKVMNSYAVYLQYYYPDGGISLVSHADDARRIGVLP